jgi:hypothetical protein
MATMFVACFSSFFHELRQAHDLLGSTFGQQSFAVNFNLYRYAPVLLAGLADWRDAQPPRRIPFPLTAAIEELTGVSDDVLMLTRRFASADERFRGFVTEGEDSSDGHTLIHLVEASATNAQNRLRL